MTPERRAGTTRVVVATTVMLSFISFWRAAAIVLNDLASTAYYIGGIAETAIGKSAPWFILAIMLFSYAVRAVYIESCGMFVRGGVYKVVREALGGTLAKFSVSALMSDYVLTGPISGVSAGLYLGALINETADLLRIPNVHVYPPYFAAAFAIAVTLYFWRKNIIGIPESSQKALRIMQVTTVMVVILIAWCLGNPHEARYFRRMLRRTFLGSSVAAAAALPATPAAGAGIKLGFDSYSIRAWRWKSMKLLDYAAGLKLDTVQLSSMDDYESTDPEHLAKVKDHAARLGIQIDAGVGCVCPSSRSYQKSQGEAAEYVVKGLRVAHAVGSGMMRCFMGSGADRRGPLPLEAHMENTIKVFRAVRSQALDLGVKIGIENHAGDMQAREVRTIIEESGKDFVGSCLDTGNPMWVVEDPFVTLEVLSPYVVTTHIRDSAVWEHPRGAAAQWVALGDGSVDFVRFVEVYRTLCPHAAMQLEVITGRRADVLPYLEPDFWKAFPKAVASEFSRFVALAKSGRPYMGDMVIGDSKPTPAVAAALKEQQKTDLERSLEYARQKLGIGVRWRA